MARIHGMPGEWARVQGVVLGLWPFFVGLFLMGFFLALAFTLTLWIIGVALAALTAAWTIWMYRKGIRRIESYFKGARGEERVAAVLKGLPDSCHVFNDYVAGKDHVDHVVVGPGGVFVVETKCWSGRVTVEEGTVLVDGHLPTHSPITQVLHETEAVRAHLKGLGWTGPTASILTFASDTLVPDQVRVRGVDVLNSAALAPWFAKAGALLTELELDRLVKLMEV